MLSDLFVMLFLVAMVLFIVYHFYIDYRNWSNTGNTFAEGMANQAGQNQYEYMQKRYCKTYDKYTRHQVPVSATQSKEKGCQIKCDAEGSNCNVMAAGDGNENGAAYNCTTYKNCALSAPGTSSSWTNKAGTTGGNFEYYKKNPSQTAPVNNLNPQEPSQTAPVNNLNPQEVMNRQTQARAGINDPMQPTVPQECRRGCVPPSGPSGNCENIMISGVPMKKCGFGCPKPTFIRGDTVNCAYDKHCNACEPKKLFDPVAAPSMPGARPGGYCPPGQNCDPRLGQPTMGQPTSSWPGTRIDVPGIHHAPGLPQEAALGGAIQLPSATRTDALRAQHTAQSIGVSNPVQPSGAGNNPWIGRPSRNLVLVPQGTSPQIQKSQPSTANPASNALFNEQVMTQVLANKNLIPADINLGIENQGNFIRVGKNFMKDVSHIRNIALPNIDNDDYESLGRVIAKIKTQETNKASTAQTMVSKKELTNSVKNILSGTVISNSQVDWETPGQKPNITTTGMYGDNSNSMMGYGDKAKKHHKEKPDGGLCLWKGCEKHEKGRPYDSVWSLY